MLKQGKVIKCVGGVFHVICDGKKLRVFSRKKLRRSGEILVGDDVVFDEIEKVIERVIPRENRLSRPPVANVDAALIFVAVEPEPDFYLVDKILLNCFYQKIDPIIVVNKTDIEEEGFFQKVAGNYAAVAEILAVSALSGEGVADLRNGIKGKTVCLAGQSAVGKTTLLNALTGLDMLTGNLSEKISRGKNTTRHSEIFSAGEDIYVIDTPGFSLLETGDIRAFELTLFYPDFSAFSYACKFNMCTHTAEPKCAVKRAVDTGLLNRERYFRYCRLYDELKIAEQNDF